MLSTLSIHHISTAEHAIDIEMNTVLSGVSWFFLGAVFLGMFEYMDHVACWIVGNMNTGI